MKAELHKLRGRPKRWAKKIDAWTRRRFTRPFTRNDASQNGPSPSARLAASACACLQTTLSASAASTSQPIQSTSAAVEHTKDDDVPHLGVLEEDDEFEEFAVAGAPKLLS